MEFVARAGRIVAGTLVVLMELVLGWVTSGGLGCFSFLEKSRRARRNEVIVVAVLGVALTALVREAGDPAAAPIIGGVVLLVVTYLLAVHIYLSHVERDGGSARARP